MRRLREIIFFLLGGGVAGLAGGEVREVVFVFEEGTSTTTGVASSTGGDAEQVVVYSGEMVADLGFDFESLEPETISFTGGRVGFSDTVHDFESFIFYDQANELIRTRITQRTQEISSLTTTPEPPGRVVGGILVNEEHSSLFDEGAVTLTITVTGRPSTNAQDYSVAPVESSISGITEVSLTEVSRTLHERLVLAELRNTIDFRDEVIYPETNATFIFSEEGTVVARGEFAVPTGFGKWAQEEELGMVLPDEVNTSGIPYGLLFSFGLSGDAREVPVSFVRDEGMMMVEVTLPNEGLRSKVTPQFSSDLSEGSWEELPSPSFEGETVVFEKGMSGAQSIVLPDGEAGFFRFIAEAPRSE